MGVQRTPELEDVRLSFTPSGQTITFNLLPDKTYGDPPLGSGDGDVGLAGDVTVSGGACSLVGATVSLTAAGSCTVTAHQVGDANYSAASDVAQTFTIQRMRVFLALIVANNP